MDVGLGGQASQGQLLGETPGQGGLAPNPEVDDFVSQAQLREQRQAEIASGQTDMFGGAPAAPPTRSQTVAESTRVVTDGPANTEFAHETEFISTAPAGSAPAYSAWAVSCC